MSAKKNKIFGNTTIESLIPFIVLNSVYFSMQTAGKHIYILMLYLYT